MLKNITLVLLFSYSSFSFSQELSAFQCSEVKKIAHHEMVGTNFNILNYGVSQEDVELYTIRGLFRSKLAYKAAELDVSLSAYAASLYDEKCRQQATTTLVSVTTGA